MDVFILEYLLENLDLRLSMTTFVPCSKGFDRSNSTAIRASLTLVRSSVTGSCLTSFPPWILTSQEHIGSKALERRREVAAKLLLEGGSPMMDGTPTTSVLGGPAHEMRPITKSLTISLTHVREKRERPSSAPTAK